MRVTTPSHHPPALKTLMSRAALMILAAVALAPTAAHAQTDGEALPPAAELLQRSIAYHDPQGLWAEGTWRLQLDEPRPDGRSRATTLVLDNARGRFELTWRLEDALIEGTLEGQGCSFKLDGSSDISDEDREKHRLTCERLAWLRNYYTYLWGLPMKLEDPGTPLDREARATTFQGRPVHALRVAYQEPVGTDTWTFYLDSETAALVGYRFAHDEEKGDGETIVLEGEAVGGGLRLPKVRSWTTNLDGEHLGTDTLVALERLDE